MKTIHGWRRVFLVSNIVSIFLITVFLAFLLIFQPVSHDFVIVMDYDLQILTPLAILPICLADIYKRSWWQALCYFPSSSKRERAYCLVPLCLALSALCNVIGQALLPYYMYVLQQAVPFPSWADVAFLSSYPFLALAILFLPGYALSSVSRTRVLLDSLIIMTAVVTFSWYFVLGPTILHGGQTLQAQFVSAAYPLSDLAMIFCLLFLTARNRKSAFRSVVTLLSLALLCIVLSDSAYGYQRLQGSYAYGHLVDFGWPLGYMLMALAAFLFRSSISQDSKVSVNANDNQVSSAEMAGEKVQMWRSLLPYILVPAVCALAIYIQSASSPVAAVLKVGVYVGAGTLIVLILFRQVLSIRETISTNEQLNVANSQLTALKENLQAKNEELAETNALLEGLATTDPLTGLPNHRALVTALDQELERAQRFQRACSLLFLDIDHFKALNDGYGHPAGDAVLCEFATTVRQVLRGMDTVGRWGGEEFLAILPETDQDEALLVAERIRVAVAEHAFPVGGGLRMTCSLGVASYPAHAPEREHLLTRADQAMYGAKKLGRNQVRRADDPEVLALIDSEQVAESRDEAAITGTVRAFLTLLDAQVQDARKHAERVGNLSFQLARELQLKESEARMLRLAGQLHDIGKLSLSETMLCKPANLTIAEWEKMRTHPVLGAEVVSHIPVLRGLAPLIRAHHERWDGGGYPDGLSAEAIPAGARILAVAEAYITMTTAQPYHLALSSVDALNELCCCSGSQFDPAVIEALQHIISATFELPEHTSQPVA